MRSASQRNGFSDNVIRGTLGRLCYGSGHGRRTLEDLRSEGTSRLSLDIKELTDDERHILAAATPILRGIAYRRLRTDSAIR
jgi:hypothetical protein